MFAARVCRLFLEYASAKLAAMCTLRSPGAERNGLAQQFSLRQHIHARAHKGRTHVYSIASTLARTPGIVGACVLKTIYSKYPHRLCAVAAHSLICPVRPPNRTNGSHKRRTSAQTPSRTMRIICCSPPSIAADHRRQNGSLHTYFIHDMMPVPLASSGATHTESWPHEYV